MKKHPNKLWNNDYTTGNWLDYEYFSKHYKLTATDLGRQTELVNPDLKQQINFIGRLKRNEGATMLFIIEKSEETKKIGNSKDCKFIRWCW